MQRLGQASKNGASAALCAGEVLVGVPAVMRYLRHQMRRRRHRGLTVPQFRALVFVAHHDNASLSDIAEHLGISLPAMSRLVGTLVRRGLMCRKEGRDDRRRISLSLTGRGRSAFRVAHAAARRSLADRIGDLPLREIARVTAAMQVLARLFVPNASDGGSSGR